MLKPRVAAFTQKALAVGFFSLFVLSGCQQAANVSGRFVSEKGVKMEEFFPADTFLVVKVGTRDADQIANIKTINAYFLGDPLGTVVKEFNDGFKKGANLDEMGLDYEKDILPILSEHSELLIAVSSAASDNNTSGKVSAVLAMTLSDSGKLQTLLQKQVDSGKLKRADYNGQTYYAENSSGDSQAFLVLDNDVAFVSTSLSNLEKGMDNLKSDTNPMLSNKTYTETMDQNYKPAIALAYGDFSKVMSFLASGSSDSQGVKDTINGMNPGLGAKDIQSEMVVLTAEKDGLRATANVLAKDGSDFTTTMGKSDKVYLASKIPAKDAVIYSEGSNLKRSYDQFLELAKTDTKFGENMAQMKSFLAAQGLDLEKDILTFLDRNFAIVLEDNGSLIPTLGFYLDAQSNPDGAAKVATKIDKSLDEVIAQSKKDSPDLAEIISKEEVIPGKLWKYKLNLDPLLVQMPAALSQKLSGQKIELYYGLLPDNVLVLALAPDLEQNYGKSSSVDQGAEYKNAMGYLNGADHSIGFVSPNQAMLYLDRLQALATEFGTDVTGGAWGIIKPYVLPLKSFSFGSKVVDKTHIHSEVFLHIGQ